MQEGELSLILQKHDSGLREGYLAGGIAGASRGETRWEMLKGEDAHAVSHITWQTLCTRTRYLETTLPDNQIIGGTLAGLSWGSVDQPRVVFQRFWLSLCALLCTAVHCAQPPLPLLLPNPSLFRRPQDRDGARTAQRSAWNCRPSDTRGREEPQRVACTGDGVCRRRGVRGVRNPVHLATPSGGGGLRLGKSRRARSRVRHPACRQKRQQRRWRLPFNERGWGRESRGTKEAGGGCVHVRRRHGGQTSPFSIRSSRSAQDHDGGGDVPAGRGVLGTLRRSGPPVLEPGRSPTIRGQRPVQHRRSRHEVPDPRLHGCGWHYAREISGRFSEGTP